MFYFNRYEYDVESVDLVGIPSVWGVCLSCGGDSLWN